MSSSATRTLANTAVRFSIEANSIWIMSCRAIAEARPHGKTWFARASLATRARAIGFRAKLRPLRSERRYYGAMSVTTNHPPGLNLPRPKQPIVPVTQNVRDWWALFVNRKAYTRRSANHPKTGRHYHYQPKNKDSGQPLELDPATVRKHLAGWHPRREQPRPIRTRTRGGITTTSPRIRIVRPL